MKSQEPRTKSPPVNGMKCSGSNRYIVPPPSANRGKVRIPPGRLVVPRLKKSSNAKPRKKLSPRSSAALSNEGAWSISLQPQYGRVSWRAFEAILGKCSGQSWRGQSPAPRARARLNSRTSIELQGCQDLNPNCRFWRPADCRYLTPLSRQIRRKAEMVPAGGYDP